MRVAGWPSLFYDLLIRTDFANGPFWVSNVMSCWEGTLATGTVVLGWRLLFFAPTAGRVVRARRDALTSFMLFSVIMVILSLLIGFQSRPVDLLGTTILTTVEVMGTISGIWLLALLGKPVPAFGLYRVVSGGRFVAKLERVGEARPT